MEKISMEENTNCKKKTIPLIPANYISILQLQERWNNEKEKQRKEEEEERRMKQQVEEEKKKEEEDLIKAEEKEKRLNRKQWGKKKKSINGGGAKFVEKEEPEVTAAIGSGEGEDTAEGLPKKNRGLRKRYDSKKKKKKKIIPDVAVVEDVVVVDCNCVSIAPPDSVVTEDFTPVKDVIRVYRKKTEKAATRDKIVVTDAAATAIETQFKDLSIKRGEIKSIKAQTKSSNRNRPNQRVRMPIGAASTMVWVKKEQNARANDGIGNGVKPFNPNVAYLGFIFLLIWN